MQNSLYNYPRSCHYSLPYEGTQAFKETVPMNILIEFENNPIFFTSPISIIKCFTLQEVPRCLAAVEQWLKKGFFVAGFISYEAGYAFEQKLTENKNYDFPLICLGCYKEPIPGRNKVLGTSGQSKISDIGITPSRKEYNDNIAAIRDYISRGEVYQVTYCIKLHFTFHGSAFHLYRELLKAQPIPYAAYLESGDLKILSMSPEMFLKKTGGSLVTKPMKGTWPRGNHFISDIFSGLRLKYDEKNRAENLMVTDLLRNDIGRIANNVRVPRIFEVDRYKTLYQMTSTVTGKIDADITAEKIFSTLLPSGSVTGTPKLRAMQIIRELEKEERKIYTGAIGYITPEKNMFFNVPIRTLLLRNGCGEMGIGGGIVWNSTAEGEWTEGMLKAKFLTELEV